MLIICLVLSSIFFVSSVSEEGKIDEEVYEKLEELEEMNREWNKKHPNNKRIIKGGY